MRRALRFSQAALVMMIFASCSASRHLAASQSDSIRIEVVERRVTIHDTVQIEIPQIEERVVVRQDSSTLSNYLAHSTAIIQPDGALFHSLQTNAQKITHPTSKDVVVRDSIIFRERIVRQVVEVPRELTRWQQLQIWGFWCLVAAVAIFLRIS
ncbi:MAG: hypothetical protein SNF93_07775 [Rikenellaceae bacterium]